VSVLTNPHLRGISQVKAQLPGNIDRYRHLDLLLCLVGADGKGRSMEFADMEAKARQSGVRLLCCAAVQEVEIWLLAGHAAKLPVPWRQARSEVSLKEKYFQSFLNQHGDKRRPAGGREHLMRQTLNNYRGLKKRCPKIQHLETRIRALASR